MDDELATPAATDESPDHSTCQTCKKPITWDDVCYVHDDTGFADCGLRIEGGIILTEAQLTGNPRSSRRTELRMNPRLTVNDTYPQGSVARPIEWIPK